MPLSSTAPASNQEQWQKPKETTNREFGSTEVITLAFHPVNGIGWGCACAAGTTTVARARSALPTRSTMWGLPTRIIVGSPCETERAGPRFLARARQRRLGKGYRA